jgi:hypothetical protein
MDEPTLYGYTIEEWVAAVEDLAEGNNAHDIVADTGCSMQRAVEIRKMLDAIEEARTAKRHIPTGRMWTPEDGRLFRIVMGDSGKPQGS